MNRSQQLTYLLQALLAEEPRYQGIPLPSSEPEKRRLLRSLMNQRPPDPIDPEFLRIQDELLSAEAAEKGIVDAMALTPSATHPRLALWKGDITRLKADAIVNAANDRLLGCFLPCHGCIDNAIHSAAGIQLRLACDELMRAQGTPEPTGTAKATPGFNLPARYVLHTVGPIISGPVSPEDCRLLSSCYTSCLALAEQMGLESVAFCCISTGEFHFPNEMAAGIAVDTVSQFLAQNQTIKKVTFDVFQEQDYPIYQQLLG